MNTINFGSVLYCATMEVNKLDRLEAWGKHSEVVLKIIWKNLENGERNFRDKKGIAVKLVYMCHILNIKLMLKVLSQHDDNSDISKK